MSLSLAPIPPPTPPVPPAVCSLLHVGERFVRVTTYCDSCLTADTPNTIRKSTLGFQGDPDCIGRLDNRGDSRENSSTPAAWVWLPGSIQCLLTQPTG